MAPPPGGLQPLGRKKNGTVAMPKIHEFRMTDVQSQSLAILSEDKAHLQEDASIRSGNLSIEGKVSLLLQKVNFRLSNERNVGRIKMTLIIWV